MLRKKKGVRGMCARAPPCCQQRFLLSATQYRTKLPGYGTSSLPAASFRRVTHEKLDVPPAARQRLCAHAAVTLEPYNYNMHRLKRLSLIVTLLGAGGVALLPIQSLTAADEVRLTGRELSALILAAKDFEREHYSRSGDLKHYTISFERSAKEVEISFVADEPKPLKETEAGTVSGTAYGIHVTYIVSLDNLKIVRFYFAR